WLEYWIVTSKIPVRVRLPSQKTERKKC
ncbi:hypothetical protein ACTFIV_011291, partial [Dictyostelium citrinum]